MSMQLTVQTTPSFFPGSEHFKFYKKCINPVLAFRPYFPFVPKNNVFGDGQPKTKAAGPASCRICPVKAFKKMLQILCGDFASFICDRQKTAPPAAAVESDPGGPFFL